MKQHKSFLLAVVALEVFLGALNAFIPYITKLQIDQLQSKSSSLWIFQGLSPVTLFIGLLIFPVSLELLRLLFFDRLSRNLDRSLNTEMRLTTEAFIWKKLTELDAGFFTNDRNRRILTSALSASSMSRDFFNFFVSRLKESVTLLAILPLMGLVSKELVVVVVVVSLLQMVLSEVARQQEAAHSAIRDQLQERFWKVDSALSYDFYTLKILGAAQQFLDQYQVLTRERNVMEIREEVSKDTLKIFEWVLNNSLTIFTNAYVGFQVLQGNASIGTFTLVVSYTLQLNGIFKTLLNSSQNWRDIDLQFDRFRFFAMLSPRVKNAENPKKISSSEKITIKNISFSYPDFRKEEREYLQLLLKKTELYVKKFSGSYYSYEIDRWKELVAEKVSSEKILHDVSFELEKGKIVALLGRNGAGKTTMTNLIMHSYEPDSGSIALDDLPLFEYNQNELIQQFGVIHQQPFVLYRFSIRENVVLGIKREIPDQEIWDVLEEIDLATAIKKFPKGLDTILGEGASLSGGQEQLLAVARVLLQHRPFLIFDEGMNQMDIEHETKIMSILKKRTNEAGILFITHRITTARKADVILMLDEGKIAEKGTHEELLKKGGLYAKFWNMQVIE